MDCLCLTYICHLVWQHYLDSTSIGIIVWFRVHAIWEKNTCTSEFEKLTSVYVFSSCTRNHACYIILIYYMYICMQSLLKTPKCLFLCIISAGNCCTLIIGYLNPLLLFHILSQSERPNSQCNLQCISFFCTVFQFLALHFEKIHCS